jgi:hypothetical protein
MTATSSLVKTIWKPWLANRPKPTRVWGNDGITCPRIAADGRDGTDARVALAIDLTGWSPGVDIGDRGIREKVETTGAQVDNASVRRWKLGGITSKYSG